MWARRQPKKRLLFPVLRYSRGALICAALAWGLLWHPEIEVQGSALASPLAGMVGVAATGIQVQNLDEVRSVTLAQDFYLQGTMAPPVTITRPNVAAAAASNVFLPSQPMLHNGVFSAVIFADRPIAAIARSDWIANGAAALYSSTPPATEVMLPLVQVEFAGGTSIVSIQNADTDRAGSVRLSLRSARRPDFLLERGLDLPAGHSATIDLRTHPDFAPLQSEPDGFLGAMRVEADVPVSVQSFVNLRRSEQAVSAFEGVPIEGASEQLVAPMVRHRYFGYDSGISVANPGDDPVTVRVRYHGADGAGASRCAGQVFEHGPVTVAGGASTVFYQGPGGGSGLPERCLATAEILASAPVMAVVNDTRDFTIHSASYTAVPREGGSTRVALPLVRNRHVDAWEMTTGIQVMNVGDAPARVRLSTLVFGGLTPECGESCLAEVPPLGSHTFFPGEEGVMMPSGVFGSAVVTADQPLVVLVNDVSLEGALDSAIYLGIPAGGEAGEGVRCLSGGEETASYCTVLPVLSSSRIRSD